jgi:succinate dehydrogenase / fumarate reductase membrane anchor subunit
MAIYGRAGRVRPQGNAWELAVWYLMRLSGLALFVLALAHFSILHFLFDPANETSQFIIDHRWNDLIWRGLDWLLLMLVLFHSSLGVRTVIADYVRGGARTLLLSALYLLTLLLYVLGTVVVMLLPSPV